MKTQHLFKVTIGHVNEASVGYTARFNVVAPDVDAALKKIRKRIERGEAVMNVERIAEVDVQ